MKIILLKLSATIMLCTLPFMSSYAQTTPGQQKPKSKTKVETNYDERKNETFALIGPFVIWEPPQNSSSGEINYERVRLSVSFSYPGKKIVKPNTVTLIVYASSHGGPEFQSNRQLSVTTESEHYKFGEAKILGSNSSRVAQTVLGPANLFLGHVVLGKTISFSDFADIARSQKVEIKIGDRKFKLTKQHVEAFRNFALLMEQEGLEF